MGKLVDLDTVPHYKITFTTAEGKFCETDMVLMKDFEKVPPIDAVQVVRCKDCKRYYGAVQQARFGEIGLCDFDDRLVKPSDYCSKGKRREDDGKA